MSVIDTSNQVGASARTSWAWIVATLFGIGHLRPGPGTWASLAAALVYWLLALWTPTHPQIVAIVLLLVAIVIGIPASTRVARESGIKDPGFVVIDEVAGQMFPLILAPLRWKYLLLSLILFRSFDIVKPPPLRALERLPGGWGIMLDDIGAGIYSLLVVEAVMKFWPVL